MRIALLGYGKMGKAIEEIAVKRGHTIPLKVSSTSKQFSLENCDVAIDFSLPNSAVANISKCLETGIPVISGTTGWLDHYQTVIDLCELKGGTFLYASNFSLGVNIFFELNKTLAKLMARLPQYKTSMEEVHHIEKLDAPSGTAISLANDIINETNYDNWVLESPKKNDIGIVAKRIENVPGTHVVNYDSQVDSIQIRHTAHSRAGFALGAVIAAEFVMNKRGVFTMKDVLNIS